jgi:hypothetical protein
MDDPKPESKPGHATGPRTPQGKARSSLNRLSHGCCSEQTVLPCEDPAEWEATLTGWLEEYNPQDAVADLLVHETALAHWLLRRARRNLDDFQYNLPPNAAQWTAEHHRGYANFIRYKTANERTFLRFFKELEQHYRRLDQKAQYQERAHARAAAIELRSQNRKLKEKITSFPPPPLFVIGNADLPGCVPAGIQLMEKQYEDWLKAIEREPDSPDGT